MSTPAIMRSRRGSDDQMTIWNLFPTVQNEYWAAWNAGAHQAAAALGMNYQGHVYLDSTDTQRELIEDAGNEGVNGIFMFCQNAASTPRLISTAGKQGIPVVNANSTSLWQTPLDPVFQGGYLRYIQANNILSVQRLCQLLFDAIGGSGKVVYLAGLPGNWSADIRREGVRRALSDNSDIKLVAEFTGGENRHAAKPVVERLLKAHPDVNAVIAYNDDSGLAALDVLKERGRTDVLVGGVDCINPFLESIIKGPNAIGSISILGAWLGAYAVVSLYDHLEGVELDPVERMLFNDSVLIDTPEAAQRYLELFDPYSENILPFDFKAMSRHRNPDTWNPQHGMEPIDPRNFWDQVEAVAHTKPKDWSLPAELQAAIDAGKLEHYAALYRERYTGGPVDELLPLTKSGQTILGHRSGTPRAPSPEVGA